MDAERIKKAAQALTEKAGTIEPDDLGRLTEFIARGRRLAGALEAAQKESTKDLAKQISEKKAEWEPFLSALKRMDEQLSERALSYMVESGLDSLSGPHGSTVKLVERRSYMLCPPFRFMDVNGYLTIETGLPTSVLMNMSAVKDQDRAVIAGMLSSFLDCLLSDDSKNELTSIAKSGEKMPEYGKIVTKRHIVTSVPEETS